MKKLTLFFLVVALSLGVGLAVVYAATSGSGTQDITGNITGTLTITAPSAFSTWETSKMTIGDNESANQGILVCSNTTYGIKIRPDSVDIHGVYDGYMRQDTTGTPGSGYTTTHLQNALQWKEESGSYAALDYNATNGGEVGTGLAVTPDAGTTTNVKFKQAINYGDEVLASGKWKLVATYLADQSW